MSGGPRRTALHVFSTFGAGGPQIRMTQIAARMPGWRHLIVPLDGDAAAAAQLPASADCELLPAPPRRPFLASVRAFRAELRQRRPDLLLTYNWGAIECVAAARSMGFRAHVHHEDGFGRDEQQRRLRRRTWLRRWLLRRVPAVIVPSTRLLAIGRQEWGLGATLLHLPNGVDCARFAPTAPPVPAGAAALPAIGTVGGLRAEKDQQVLLRAVAAMQRPARVVLVGDGPERARLLATAAALQLGARAEFVGAVRDTAPHYGGFAVFALSSRTEQMPLSVLEAMASGLPIASSDVGDVGVMLPAACRSALVPPGDPLALARVLDALLADPARRAREGAANRAHCAAHYELGVCLDRFVAVYERVAVPAGQPPAGPEPTR